MQVRFKRLNDNAVLPRPAHEGDALDLAAIDEVILEPNVPTLVKTGWAIEMPPDVRGWVTPRSGLALKHGVTVLNAPGLIDPQYRGEVGVILVWGGHAPNHSADDSWPVYWEDAAGNKTAVRSGPRPRYRISTGDRIAQLTFQRIEAISIIESSDLTETARAAGGFGSTG